MSEEGPTDEENPHLEAARELWVRLQRGVLRGFNSSERLVDAMYLELQRAAKDSTENGGESIDITSLDAPELGRKPRTLREMEEAIHEAARKAEMTLAHDLLDTLKKSTTLTEEGREELLENLHSALERAGVKMEQDLPVSEMEKVIRDAEVAVLQ